MILLELIESLGIYAKKVSVTSGGEYHSPCPSCGGTDRFFFQPARQTKNCKGMYRCRQCGIQGDTIQFCRDIMGLTWEEAVKRCHAEVHLESNRSRYTKPVRKFAEGTPPNAKWKEKALSFVNYAHKQLLSNPSYLEFLSKRGISLQTIEKYKLGFSENKKSRYRDFQVTRESFGLEENGKTLWIPAGYVIPSLEPSGEVIRIKIRRSKWKPDDKIGKYIALSGSMFGMTILGDRSRQTMVVVESELDAYSLLEKIDDVAMVIACGGNTKNPDRFTDHLVKTRRVFLCYDNDEGGDAMKNMWSKLYLKAICISTPSGKDIGEFIEKGGDISSWIRPILDI